MTDDINTLRDRVRRLEADNADLRRDYHDLCALDPDGLRAKVVALQDTAVRHAINLADTAEDAAKAWEQVRALSSQVRMLEFNANPAVVAHDIAEAKRAAATMGDYLRLANADVERLAGAPVAEVLLERRREIRDLTGRLNDALALVDRVKAAARAFVAANDAADGATAMMDAYSSGGLVEHANPHAVRDAAYAAYKAARKALESMIGGES